jgi:hypothetical protein
MNRILAAILLSAAVTAPAGVNAASQPDLTRAEAKARADQIFDRFDLNQDGLVTRQEAELLGRKLLLLRASTGRDVAPGIGGHTLRFLRKRFSGMDAVNKQQFEDAFLAHFDAMDANHDGILTAAERKEAR